MATGTSPSTADVSSYLRAIADGHRALFDRVHQLVLRSYPDVSVVLSYGMPTYRAGSRSLIVGVWKHGLSFYGMAVTDAAELIARHDLRTSKGTIQVREQDAAGMTDAELGDLIAAALGPAQAHPAGEDRRR